MKRIVSLLLLFTFCVSLASCAKVDIDEVIQGEWVKAAEAQSGTRVTLFFSKGTVIRTEFFGDTKNELTGVYNIDDKGFLLVAYANNTTQTFSVLATEDGTILRDNDSMTVYTRK